jgi:RNA polymerase sigma-70 factor, ECF subfamily
VTVATPQTDERQLIEAAQRDPVHFGELYERYFERVYAYVAKRVGSRHEAEDVTSDVFHRALENLSKFEWRGVPFVAWLYRIAANCMSDRWQRTNRESGDPLPDDAASVNAQDFAEVERRAMLSQYVAELPEIQRRVILGRFVEQKSIREIATQLRRTEGAIKQLQFRAIHSLRARMDETHA